MPERINIEVLIIGAGIVGLACASEFAHAGYTTLVVERNAHFGEETSSRNSEVIHSGIYYTPGSLKAQLCVKANRTTYKDCNKFGVWHRQIGKLIVAVTETEEKYLLQLHDQGKTNGVDGVTLLGKQQAAKVEPHIRCTAALYLQSTGILDSHQLMSAYEHDACDNGTTFVYRTSFLGASKNENGYSVRLKEANGTESEVDAGYIINAAGFRATDVARSIGFDTDACGYHFYPNRGHYFRVAMSKSSLVSHLVYPVPLHDQAGLGIHITVDKSGQIKLGPDTEYIDPNTPPEQWYRFDESRKESFFKAVVRYFPAIAMNDLSPDQVGVRPKIQAPGKPLPDFIINEESKRGFPGIVNLIGIESPGLTCAREIAKKVLERIQNI